MDPGSGAGVTKGVAGVTAVLRGDEKGAGAALPCGRKCPSYGRENCCNVVFLLLHYCNNIQDFSCNPL